MKRRSRIVLLVAGIALLSASCGGDGGSDQGSAGGDSTVSVTLSDFEIGLDPTTASAGEVTFDITNGGPSVHEFVVFRTDLAADDLPSEDGVVSEDTEGLELIDEVEDVEVDQSTELSVDLDTADYVMICNIPGHYDAGMHTSFTVD